MKKRATTSAAPAAPLKRALDDLESPVPSDFPTSRRPGPRFLLGIALTLLFLLGFLGRRTPPAAAPGAPELAPGQRPAAFTEDRAAELNELLKNKEPGEILRWLAANLPGRVAQFTSFGPSGLVLLEQLASNGLLEEVPVVTVDTLHLFAESYALLRNLSRRYRKLKLRTFFPHGFDAGQQAAFDAKYGEKLWKEDYPRYAYLSKVEPTQRALESMQLQAWITGRRRSQGGERGALEVVEWDNGRLKVNPLANWTQAQVWAFIREKGLEYNALHDRGYGSVGDVMTTRPLKEGETERAGRFEGNRSECGMHSHNQKIESMREEAREHGVPFVVPELDCDACQEVTPGNFWEAVLETKRPLLMEFYSPFCGHCHAFAPTYEKVARRVKGAMGVARMDIISHDIPPVGKDAGFELDAYPGIFLVLPKASGGLDLRKYRVEDGEAEDRLLAWLKAELPQLPPDL